MHKADLYLDKIDFRKYLDNSNCSQCGFISCDAFIEALTKKEISTQACPFVERNKSYAFEAVKQIAELWPEVPLLMHPRPGQRGLVEINQPDESSLVLISGNNEYTEQVLLTVLGTTQCPFHVIFVDTGGNSVDMSMIYKTLTAEGICKALQASGFREKRLAKELIIPGLAGSLRREIEELTGWSVTVGPLCAAELPLFLSEIWMPP